MRYIEALETWGGELHANEDFSLFLGGGISNCSPWQDYVVQQLADTDIVVLNPRRKNFPMDDPQESEKQIQWEFDHLELADSILFWFCAETLCPITLFEYGKWITSDKRLFVGCDPAYARLSDVKIQTQLESPWQHVHTCLDDLIAEVKSY